MGPTAIYGDFTPQTVAGRAFTVFYVLVGLGIVVALMTQVAGHVVAAHTAARDRKQGETGPTARPAAG